VASNDRRKFAESTTRNHGPILEVLEPRLPASGTVLEIASGSGEHAALFAPQFPHLTWQPSDIDEAALESIEGWRQHTGAENIRPALRLDMTDLAAVNEVLPDDITAITNCNMIHISPWACCTGLMELAGQRLPADGLLFLYGPYNRGGQFTAPSNAAFDNWLKSQNDDWGIRDLEAVVDCATVNGLAMTDIIDMPANNFSLIFRRLASHL